MTEFRQGKCPTCKVAYRWKAKEGPLKWAQCPECGSKLQATTHLLQWPWIDFRTPKFSAFYATRSRKSKGGDKSHSI